MRASLALLAFLFAVPAWGAVTVAENGDGTSTVNITIATYNIAEICTAFKIREMACGSEINGVQWAVDGGHCTAQEAADGVLVKDAAAYGSPTCDATAIANNRCRDASDPLADQTGYIITKGSVCVDFLTEMEEQIHRQWRDSGYSILESLNVTLAEPSGPLD